MSSYQEDLAAGALIVASVEKMKKDPKGYPDFYGFLYFENHDHEAVRFAADFILEEKGSAHLTRTNILKTAKKITPMIKFRRNFWSPLEEFAKKSIEEQHAKERRRKVFGPVS